MDLDRHLDYDTCITNTIKKGNYKIWLLAKVRYYITVKRYYMAVEIYNLPYFDYSDVI